MMSRVIKKYPFTLILTAVIFYLSLMDVPEVDLGDVRFIDKWVHFVMYGSLTATIYAEKLYALYKSGMHPLFAGIEHHNLLLFTLLPVSMGGLLELLQAYCTNGHRSGDWLDFAANTTGVLIILAIVAIVRLCSLRTKLPK